jgi:hypothetical protein
MADWMDANWVGRLAGLKVVLMAVVKADWRVEWMDGLLE